MNNDANYDITPASENWDLSGANPEQLATAEMLRNSTGFGFTGTELGDILMGSQPAGYEGRWIDSSGKFYDTRPQGNKTWFDEFMNSTFGQIAPLLEYTPQVIGAGLTYGGGLAAELAGGLGATAANIGVTGASAAEGAIAGGITGASKGGDSIEEVLTNAGLGAAGGAVVGAAMPTVSSYLPESSGATPGFEEAWTNANPGVFSGADTITPGYGNIFSEGLQLGIDPTLALPSTLNPESSFTFGGGYVTDAADRIAQGIDQYDDVASGFSPENAYQSGNVFGEGLGLTGPSGNYFDVNPDLSNYNDFITAQQQGRDFGKDLTWNKTPNTGSKLPDFDSIVKGLTAANTLYKLLTGGGEEDIPGAESGWGGPAVDGSGKASGVAGGDGGGTPSGSLGLSGDLARRSKGIFTNPISDEIARFGGQQYYS